MHYEYVLKAWQQQKNQDQNSYDCGPLSLMAWLEQERAYSCSTKYHVPVHPSVRLWQIAFLNEMIHFAIWQFSHKNLKVIKCLFLLLTSYREKNVKYIMKPKRKKVSEYCIMINSLTAFPFYFTNKIFLYVRQVRAVHATFVKNISSVCKTFTY
jgi:hypothetical protein